MKKIYGYDLYKKRTGNDFYTFIKDYLKFEETGAELDVKIDLTEEFIQLVTKHKESTIAIFGDYDVDGISASSIMYKGLKKFGIKDILTYIPNRFSDGYGMNNKMVTDAYDKEVKLIITVDNGIKAIEEVKMAKELGMDVIVTDHHLPGDVIPTADIVINPHIGKQNLKTGHICGAMIAYLLIQALLNGSDLKEEKFLAAMATITDVMPLVYENRTLIKEIVERTRQDKTTYNKGLDYLFLKQGISFDTFSLETISFKIGPFLNTPGRLYKADLSYDLLTSSLEKLPAIYDEITKLNQERKMQMETLKQNAMALLDKADLANIIILDDTNEGLIGILAGSICEKTGKPTFIFAKTIEGVYKASGRSPKWCDLSEVTKDFWQEIMPLAYGGHANAMGLTLKDESDVLNFKALLEAKIKDMPKDELKTYLRYPTGFSIKEVRDILDKFAPFGEGNKEPSFAITTKLDRPIIIGKKHSKFYFNINNERIEGLQFYNIPAVGDGYYNVYFKINKEYSNYSKRIEYKFMIEEIEEYKVN